MSKENLNTITEMEATDILSELESVEEDLLELEEVFGDLELDDDDQQESSDELSQLNAELAGTEFEMTAEETSSTLSILQIADGVMPEQSSQELFGLPNPFKWIPNIFKRKAKRIVRKVLRLVKRHKKLALCVPAVTKAVIALKAGKYGTAFKAGISAYRCIKRKL